MTEVRVLLRVLGVLVLLGFAVGCGLVSDQTKQEAKNKIEAKGQQAKQEARKKVEAKGQQVKQEVKKKVEAGQRT
jgi:Tfp pilus assembly protein FimT